MRQGLINEIAKNYVMKYTCGAMDDHLADMEREQNEANDWLFTKINELHITKEELKKAIEVCETDAANNGSACCYAFNLFSTVFFRQ